MADTAGGEFDIARTVVVYSPSYEHLLAGCVEDLQESRFGKGLLQLSTVAGGWEANAQHLSTHLQPGDALAIIGGEGTFRDVAGALVSKEMGDVADQVAITSIDGGNGHDIRRATHRAWPRSPSWLLAHSRAHNARALDITLERDGTTAQHIGISYVGVGRSAQQTRKVATPAYREDRPIWRDAKIGIGVLASRSNFVIEDTAGVSRPLAELAAVKGPRMAKAGHWPIRHWDPEFIVKATRSTLWETARTALQMATNTVTGYRRVESYDFTVQNWTQMHIDGDPPLHLLAQTAVHIGLSERSYKLLASK